MESKVMSPNTQKRITGIILDIDASKISKTEKEKKKPFNLERYLNYSAITAPGYWMQKKISISDNGTLIETVE